MGEKVNVEEEIERLFRDMEEPQLTVSAAPDFDTNGKIIGGHVNFSYNEKDADGNPEPA